MLLSTLAIVALMASGAPTAVSDASPSALALLQTSTPAPPVSARRPAAPPTRARGPRPLNAGTWIGQNDYPIGALANAQSGSVGFTVQVGADGLPRVCTVTSPSGWPLLDQTTCQLVATRARFDPALDARGRRIPGTYRNRVIWRLPPTEAVPAPPAQP